MLSISLSSRRGGEVWPGDVLSLCGEGTLVLRSTPREALAPDVLREAIAPDTPDAKRLRLPEAPPVPRGTYATMPGACQQCPRPTCRGLSAMAPLQRSAFQ